MAKNKIIKKSESILIYGASLGAAFGAAFGVVFKSIDIALGISIGIALGAAIALIFGKNLVQLFGNPDKTDSSEEKE